MTWICPICETEWPDKPTAEGVHGCPECGQVRVELSAVERVPRAPLDPATAPRTESGPLVMCQGIVHVFEGDGLCQCGQNVWHPTPGVAYPTAAAPSLRVVE